MSCGSDNCVTPGGSAMICRLRSSMVSTRVATSKPHVPISADCSASCSRSADSRRSSAARTRSVFSCTTTLMPTTRPSKRKG